MEHKYQEALNHIKEHLGRPDIVNIEEAVKTLYGIFESKHERYADILQCPACQNFLAIGLWRGKLNHKEPRKAYDLLLEAAKAGFAKAQANLGTYLRSGELGFVDYGSALYWYNRAAEQHDLTAESYLKKYSNIFPTILKEQEHGDHLSASSSMTLAALVNETLTNGKKVECVETMVNLEENHPMLRKVFSLETEDGEISHRALIVAKETTNEFISLYPIIRDGSLYNVVIEDIYEWDNGVEATIKGRIGEHLISFFMTDYHLNKDKIVRGNSYKFRLAALAYSCEELKERTFQFEGQKAIDFLQKIGDKPKYDENGEIEPLVFSLENMVAFFQHNEKYPDDMQYQSPISSYSEIKAGTDSFYKVIITVFRDPDITLPLYTKQDLVNFKIEDGLPILGSGWVLGSLEPQKYKVLPNRGYSYVLDENGEPMPAYYDADSGLFRRSTLSEHNHPYFLNIRRPIIIDVEDENSITVPQDLPQECDGVIFKKPQTDSIVACYILSDTQSRCFE